MATYTKRTGFQNSTIYTRNGRPVKTNDVPSTIVELLRNQEVVDEDGLKLEKPYERCIFCKDFTHLSRVVNQQTVAVCQEHFYSKTIGQIAQEVRLNEEISGEKV